MDFQYLEKVACGYIYPVKQANGLIADHLTDEGYNALWAYKKSPCLIRGQICLRCNTIDGLSLTAITMMTVPKTGSNTKGVYAFTAICLFYLGHIAHQNYKDSFFCFI